MESILVKTGDHYSKKDANIDYSGMLSVDIASAFLFTLFLGVLVSFRFLFFYEEGPCARRPCVEVPNTYNKRCRFGRQRLLWQTRHALSETTFFFDTLVHFIINLSTQLAMPLHHCYEYKRTVLTLLFNSPVLILFVLLRSFWIPYLFLATFIFSLFGSTNIPLFACPLLLLKGASPSSPSSCSISLSSPTSCLIRLLTRGAIFSVFVAERNPFSTIPRGVVLIGTRPFLFEEADAIIPEHGVDTRS
ncbi:hypothetical protein PFISCL1PPCAC_479, partial [Pristionchus fissidentatus]